MGYAVLFRLTVVILPTFNVFHFLLSFLFFINIKCFYFYSTFPVAVFKSLSAKCIITVFVFRLLWWPFPLRLNHMCLSCYFHTYKIFTIFLSWDIFNVLLCILGASKFCCIFLLNNINFLWLMIQKEIDLFSPKLQTLSLEWQLTSMSWSVIPWAVLDCILHVHHSVISGHLHSIYV